MWKLLLVHSSCTFNLCPLGSDWQPRHQLLSMELLVLMMWTPVLQQMNWANTYQFTICVIYPTNWISEIHSEMNNKWHWVEMTGNRLNTIAWASGSTQAAAETPSQTSLSFLRAKGPSVWGKLLQNCRLPWDSLGLIHSIKPGLGRLGPALFFS